MSSGYVPAKDEPSFEQILGALREAVQANPRLKELPTEEVARQLVLDDRLSEEPAPPLVAEALESLDAEKQSFQTDEIPPEEGNPT
jgi:hypothetical protein